MYFTFFNLLPCWSRGFIAWKWGQNLFSAKNKFSPLHAAYPDKCFSSQQQPTIRESLCKHIEKFGVAHYLISTLLRAPKLDFPQKDPCQFQVWWHMCQMDCHLPSVFAAVHLGICQHDQQRRRNYSGEQGQSAEQTWRSLHWRFG